MSDRKRPSIERYWMVEDALLSPSTRSPLFSARNAAAASFLLLGAAVASKYIFKKDPAEVPKKPEAQLGIFPSGDGAIDVYAIGVPENTSPKVQTFFKSRREKSFIAIFGKMGGLNSYEEETTWEEFDKNTERAVEKVKEILKRDPLKIADLQNAIFEEVKPLFGRNSISFALFFPYLDAKNTKSFYCFVGGGLAIFDSSGADNTTKLLFDNEPYISPPGKLIFSLNSDSHRNPEEYVEGLENASSTEDIATAFANVEKSRSSGRIENIAFSVQPLDGIENNFFLVK